METINKDRKTVNQMHYDYGKSNTKPETYYRKYKDKRDTIFAYGFIGSWILHTSVLCCISYLWLRPAVDDLVIMGLVTSLLALFPTIPVIEVVMTLACPIPPCPSDKPHQWDYRNADPILEEITKYCKRCGYSEKEYYDEGMMRAPFGP